MPASFSTLIFDLDGTLSDPIDGIVRSINHALRQHQQPERAPEDLRWCIGPPLDESFARLVPAASKEQVLALVASYRERYAVTGYAENTLYPQVRETLAQLAASGVRMGVCTSKRVDFAEAILKLFDIRQYFAFVSGGDVDISKSSQLAALLQQGEIDGQALMIGDRKHDLLAARENGLRCAAVRWGYGSEAELQACAPDFVLDAPAQWLGWCLAG